MNLIEKSAYLRNKRLALAAVFILILAALPLLAYFTMGFAASAGQNVWLLLVAVLVLAGFAAARIFERRGLNYDNGMLGEYKVKLQLQTLDSRFTVFHNLKTGNKSDVDFAVIGPSGIFAIEVKRYRYPSERDLARFLRQTRAETVGLSKYIQSRFGKKEWVTAVLVLVDLKKHVGLGVRQGVHVITPEVLPDLISGHPVLSAQAKEALVSILDS